ncbi:MAG: hypothetical protein LUD72_00985 [Bacteroidales bacterium]|nr:hypothetical protein [Bacteroidales bacterium]
MSRKQIRILIPLGALLLMLVVLTGCRPSDALTRLMNAMNALNPSTEEMKTEDEQEENEPDENMDPIDEQRDDAKIEETEELIGQMLENMDWETAQESLMAVYSASADGSEWGAQQYNPDRLTYGNGNGNSPLVLNVKGDEVNSASKIAGSGEGSGTGEASVIETTDALNDEGEETALPLTDPDETVSPTETIGSGEGGESPADNKDGEPQDPLNGTPGDGNPGDPDPNEGGTSSAPDYSHEPWPNAGSRIAATGELANVVCMLGGSDRLCATSESFRDNTLAQKAFNSGDQMEYETLWTGDGSYYLSETDFVYLMEYLEPDICFDFNYTSFSPEQEARMADYGVTYVSMSAMTSQSNINDCMYTVANKMGSEEAEAIVNNYIVNWVNYEVNSLSHIQDRCGQKETVFIENWDDTVQTKYTPEGTAQTMTVATGAAVVKIGYSFRPLNECLVNAEVYDWAAEPHVRGLKLDSSGYGPGKSGTDVLTDFFWCDLTGQTTTDIANYGSLPGSLCYVTPVYDPVFAQDVYAQSVEFYGGQYGAIDNSIFTIEGTYTLDGRLSFGNVFPGYSDGTVKWNTVIVKNENIKKKLEEENNPWKYNNSYDTWSANRDVGINVTYNGILHPKNGSTYYTTVCGDYDIYVNPTGLGDWVEGSPESFMETVWAAEVIQGYREDGYTRDLVYRFYRDFYGYTLSSGELDDILSGKLADN